MPTTKESYVMKKERVIKEIKSLVTPEDPEASIPATSRTIRILVGFCIASTLAFVSSIGCIIIIALKLGPDTNAVVYRDNELCAPCHMVGGRNGALAELTSERQKQICCFGNRDGKNTDILRALEMIAEEYEKGYKNTRENSLHVYYSENAKKKRDLSLPLRPKAKKLRNWATSGNRIHVGEGIGYEARDGFFEVGVTGNYMIYSHMAFQPPPHKVKGQNVTFLFSHTVSIKSNNPAIEDDVIMEDGSEVTCSHSDEYGGQLYPCHVSSLVSMLPLNKGDKLSVDVAPSQYLLGELKSSYFGLFLIG